MADIRGEVCNVISALENPKIKTTGLSEILARSDVKIEGPLGQVPQLENR